MTITPVTELSGPTWGVFQLSNLPGALSFNVHSIIITGTNPVAVTNPAGFTVPVGQQNDGMGLLYTQSMPPIGESLTRPVVRHPLRCR